MSEGVQGPRRAMREEAESISPMPPVVATKTQGRGALGGALGGAVIGAVVGLLIGLFAFDGTLGLVIATLAFGAAGAVAGGVSGGITRPAQKLQSGEADR